MPEKQVSITLTFATDSAPAALAARVIDISVAEVAANLIGANWHGYEIDDESDQDAARPHVDSGQPPEPSRDR
ncbi:hypothetical protein KMT30_05890 [Streptomyces sp. IBSBF 2953]|nr:hypothetical protein [Streptomyces hayashii]